MPSVADDFAAISKRLKEIVQEVAAEAAARTRDSETERKAESGAAYKDDAVGK